MWQDAAATITAVRKGRLHARSTGRPPALFRFTTPKEYAILTINIVGIFRGKGFVYEQVLSKTLQ